MNGIFNSQTLQLGSKEKAFRLYREQNWLPKYSTWRYIGMWKEGRGNPLEIFILAASVSYTAILSTANSYVQAPMVIL